MNDVDAISDDALRSQTQLTSALAATCRGVTRFATTLAASKLNAGSTMLLSSRVEGATELPSSHSSASVTHVESIPGERSRSFSSLDVAISTFASAHGSRSLHGGGATRQSRFRR
jgi:hypothetical protein